MKRYWLFPLPIFIAGCLASNGLQYEAMSETNQYRLARVQKGMSQTRVLQIMHRPYSYESFEVDGDIYDVWFYVTRPTGLDQTRMVPQNLTPLTFKNGVLVGNGYSWYYFAMREEAKELEPEHVAPKKEKQIEEEDKEFEKALRPYPVSNPHPDSSSDSMPKEKESEKKEKLPPNVRIVSTEEVSNPTGKIAPKSFKKLRKGMKEEEVTQRVGQPEQREILSVDQESYEIWFYETKDKSNLFPLIFKSGVLIDTGMRKYNKLKQKAEQNKIQPFDEESERRMEEESEQNFNYW